MEPVLFSFFCIEPFTPQQQVGENISTRAFKSENLTTMQQLLKFKIYGNSRHKNNFIFSFITISLFVHMFAQARDHFKTININIHEARSKQ